MLKANGIIIPTTIEELVDPRHTAILVIDAQNDFCEEKGCSDYPEGDLSDYRRTIKNIRRLVDAARHAGVRVVYTMNTTLPYNASDSPSLIRFRVARRELAHPVKIPAITLQGSWGEQIISELKPGSADVVVNKYRASGFIQTNLDLILRSNNVKTLVITGFTSNGCVFATAGDGAWLDYFIVVAKDCVNSPRKDLHQAAMMLMEWRFDSIFSEQIVNVWRNKTQSAQGADYWASI